MPNYYYVGVALPPLSFERPPEISFYEFENLLKANLTQKDFEKTKIIRLYYDILNIKSFWLEEELDPRGLYNETDLEEAIVEQVGLPDYVYEYIARFEKTKDRLSHFSELLAQFYQSAERKTSGFLHDYLNFEREMRLVFTAFRAKKLGRDLSIELQYEDPEEDLIAQMLAQKDAKAYEPPEKYQDLKVLFDKYGEDPLALQKALDEYRFNSSEKMLDMNDSFSINRILAYMVQLILVEKWFELDKQKGRAVVDTIIKEKS